MLESNWVRVCELEERSLKVSHCCRRQTDRQTDVRTDRQTVRKKHVSRRCSDITHYIVHRQNPASERRRRIMLQDDAAIK